MLPQGLVHSVRLLAWEELTGFVGCLVSECNIPKLHCTLINIELVKLHENIILGAQGNAVCHQFCCIYNHGNTDHNVFTHLIIRRYAGEQCTQ